VIALHQKVIINYGKTRTIAMVCVAVSYLGGFRIDSYRSKKIVPEPKQRLVYNI
jgi:hypothetical protein